MPGESPEVLPEKAVGKNIESRKDSSVDGVRTDLLEDFLNSLESGQFDIITPDAEEKYKRIQKELSERKDLLMREMIRRKCLEEPETREHGISRILGGSAEDASNAAQEYKERFGNQQPEAGEREKDSEQENILKEIISRMPDFVRMYGGTPVDGVNADHFHLIDPRDIAEGDDDKYMLKDSKGAGGYSVNNQGIGISFGASDERRRPIVTNPLFLASTSAHELIHLHSFQSKELAKDEKGKGLKDKTRRAGLSIRSSDDSTVYLSKLNEAITEELARRFGEMYFPEIPQLKRELDRRNEYLSEKYPIDRIPSKLDEVKFIYETDDPKGRKTIREYVSGYADKQKDLEMIIDSIHKRFPDKFNSKEDVFRLFAEAAMTGKLLELARIIEKTYGKGAFRRMAESD